MIFEEKTISTKRIYDGYVVNVRVDTVLLPDGKEAPRDIVEHPGGVGVVAVTEDKKILMVKQYRKPIEKAIYEIPAGKLDKGEDSYACGLRELEEETGFKCENMTYLGHMYPSPGFTDEVTHIYFTDSLVKGTVNPDEDEFLDVEAIEIGKLKEMILKNEINDAKTVFGVLKALVILGL